MNLEPEEISAQFSKIAALGEELRGLLLLQAKDAATSGETGWLVIVSNAAKEIEDGLARIEPVGARFVQIAEEILGFEKNDRAELGPNRLRRISVEVTEGMLNQSLLSLTVARKRGVVSLGEDFKFILPNGTEFKTELIEPGNKIRERGWIREFYRQHSVSAGDRVLLEEIQPRVWKISKENIGPTPLDVV